MLKMQFLIRGRKKVVVSDHFFCVAIMFFWVVGWFYFVFSDAKPFFVFTLGWCLSYSYPIPTIMIFELIDHEKMVLAGR